MDEASDSAARDPVWRDWVTIWQSELAAMAADRELQEAAQRGIDLWAAGALAAGRDAAGLAGPAAAAGAAAVAAAPDGSDGDGSDGCDGRGRDPAVVADRA